MNKYGRPSKFVTHVKPRFDEIKKWISEGLTEKEIAENLGVNAKVFCGYKKEYPELNDLLLDAVKKRVKHKSESWSVYKHTFPNGKVYIGITGKKPEQRWAKGKGYGKNTYIRSAIEKYGWENVEHEILFDDLTEEEAKVKEIELIKQYDSNFPDHGYNLTCGGEGYVLTPEQRRRNALRKRNFGSVMIASGIQDILDNINTVQMLSSKGYTKEEIANVLGVARTTWYEWEKKEPIIKEAVDLGRIEAVQAIKAALFKRATGFSYTEKKVITKKILLDGEDGEKIPADLVQTSVCSKYVLPDPASAMILLKHWDKDNEWTNDPASLALKKQELELKKKHMESEDW